MASLLRSRRRSNLAAPKKRPAATKHVAITVAWFEQPVPAGGHRHDPHPVAGETTARVDGREPTGRGAGSVTSTHGLALQPRLLRARAFPDACLRLRPGAPLPAPVCPPRSC